jgi:hypothetical protein
MVKLDSRIHAEYANLAKAFRGSGTSNYLRSSGTASTTLAADFAKTTIDRDKVLNTLEKRVNFVLYKFGAAVKTTAQRSMRYRRRMRVDKRFVVRKHKKGLKGKSSFVEEPYRGYPASKPGEPPFAHQQPNIRKMMMFAVERQEKNVVIGPLPKSKMIAELMEYGGWRKMKQAWAKNKKGQYIISSMNGWMLEKQVQYPARPFMRPAFRKLIEESHHRTSLDNFLKRSRLGEALKDSIRQQATSQVSR